MRSLLISSFALLSLLSPMMTAGVVAADEQPIKDRLQEFQSAWNKDDTTAMAAVWADDGSLINPVGVFAQGRDEIVKVFVQEHTSPGPFKATKYATSDVKFQWVTPDVAVVDVSANVSGIRGSDGAATPDYAHHVVWVFVKKGGMWMAAAARPYQFGAKLGRKK